MNHAMRNLLAAALLGCVSSAGAADVPQHAQGLDERLVSVELAPGVRQDGVLSLKNGGKAPTHLAVLLPGNPSESSCRKRMNAAFAFSGLRRSCAAMPRSSSL